MTSDEGIIDTYEDGPVGPIENDQGGRAALVRIALERVIHVQRGVVRRHAVGLVDLAQRMDKWPNGLPFMLSPAERRGVQSALVYALTELQLRDGGADVAC